MEHARRYNPTTRITPPPVVGEKMGKVLPLDIPETRQSELKRRVLVLKKRLMEIARSIEDAEDVRNQLSVMNTENPPKHINIKDFEDRLHDFQRMMIEHAEQQLAAQSGELFPDAGQNEQLQKERAAVVQRFAERLGETTVHALFTRPNILLLDEQACRELRELDKTWDASLAQFAKELSGDADEDFARIERAGLQEFAKKIKHIFVSARQRGQLKPVALSEQGKVNVEEQLLKETLKVMVDELQVALQLNESEDDNTAAVAS